MNEHRTIDKPATDPVVETYWAGWWSTQQLSQTHGALTDALRAMALQAFKAGYACGRAEEKIGAK